MGAVEILVIIGASAIVLGVIIAAVIRKKKGKSSCDCGCCSCCNKNCSVKKPTDK